MPEDTPPRFTPTAPSGLQRLWKALKQRPDVGQVVVGVLVGLLAFGAVLQVRGDEEDALSQARRNELFQILDGLTRQGERLEDQVAELETNRQELLTGADTEQAAVEQAKERARQLSILTGSAPATGPGIDISISDPQRNVTAVTFLSAVQELRDTGAEAIQIEGGRDTAVRIVAGSYFLDSDSGVTVSGVPLEPPYNIVAIGDAGTLASAMGFPGGVTEKFEEDGGEVTVTEHDEVTVDALHDSTPPEYAQPAPEEND
ncbi:MAG: DUF881 domain-containing protein [Jiangellaceae bacterium]